VAYINAADALGVSIGGIRAGDVIQVDSMSGLATFEKADGNPYLSSFLIVGEAAGVPDKVLKLADKVAKQFQDPEGTPKKTRDAGGRDSEGVFRRQEGGVIACMPAARGAFYSSRSRSTIGPSPSAPASAPFCSTARWTTPSSSSARPIGECTTTSADGVARSASATPFSAAPSPDRVPSCLGRSLARLAIPGQELGADALLGEDLEQDDVGDAAVDDVGGAHAPLDRREAGLDLRDHAA